MPKRQMGEINGLVKKESFRENILGWSSNHRCM
jgi:hypothetical protein